MVIRYCGHKDAEPEFATTQAKMARRGSKFSPHLSGNRVKHDYLYEMMLPGCLPTLRARRYGVRQGRVRMLCVAVPFDT